MTQSEELKNMSLEERIATLEPFKLIDLKKFGSSIGLKRHTSLRKEILIKTIAEFIEDNDIPMDIELISTSTRSGTKSGAKSGSKSVIKSGTASGTRSSGIRPGIRPGLAKPVKRSGTRSGMRSGSRTSVRSGSYKSEVEDDYIDPVDLPVMTTFPLPIFLQGKGLIKLSKKPMALDVPLPGIVGNIKVSNIVQSVGAPNISDVLGDPNFDIEKLKKSKNKAGYSSDELKKYCTMLGCNVSGKKSVLAERILKIIQPV